jgi:hypothetical protein
MPCRKRVRLSTGSTADVARPGAGIRGKRPDAEHIASARQQLPRVALARVSSPVRVWWLPLHGRRRVSVRGLGERRELRGACGICIVLDEHALIAQAQHRECVSEVVRERARHEPERRVSPARAARLAPVECVYRPYNVRVSEEDEFDESDHEQGDSYWSTLGCDMAANEGGHGRWLGFGEMVLSTRWARIAAYCTLLIHTIFMH